MDLDPEDYGNRVRMVFTQKKETADAYARLFSTPDGDVVLRDILSKTGVFAAGFSDSPTAMSFNEGCRQTGLYILEKLEESKVDTHALLRRVMASINTQKQGV